MRDIKEIANDLQDYAYSLTGAYVGDPTSDSLLLLAGNLRNLAVDVTEIADELKYANSPWKPIADAQDGDDILLLVPGQGSYKQLHYVTGDRVKTYGGGSEYYNIEDLAADRIRFMLVPKA